MTGSAAAWPRTPFSSSSLIRCLSDLDLGDGPAAGFAAPPKPTLAARLGDWLGWTDAIALSAALQRGAEPAPGPAAPVPGFDAAQAFARVRQDLTLGVLHDAVFAEAPADPGQTPSAPLPSALPGGEAVTGFLPYRRGYLAHQRAMDARIGPLRVQVRAALAARSPALRQLAALDAAMDAALGPRERHLLAKVPAVLERHYARLQPALPTPQAAPGLSAFCRDAQGVLLAELDFRLQATAGMVEALGLEAAGAP